MSSQPPRHVDPWSNDQTSDSDEDYAESNALDLDADLSSIAVSTLKQLNFARDYIPTWDLNEAFREMYQNW